MDRSRVIEQRFRVFGVAVHQGEQKRKERQTIRKNTKKKDTDDVKERLNRLWCDGTKGSKVASRMYESGVVSLAGARSLRLLEELQQCMMAVDETLSDLNYAVKYNKIKDRCGLSEWVLGFLRTRSAKL